MSFLLIPPLPNQVIARLLPICHSNFKICGRNPVVLPFRLNLGRILNIIIFLLKEIWITSLKWVCEMTVISDYLLPSSFFSSERDGSIHFDVVYRLHMLLCRSFVCWSWLSLFFFLHFIMKWQQTLSSFFLCKRQWQFNLKSMKMGWIRQGEAGEVGSITEPDHLRNDSLWLISRLNTASHDVKTFAIGAFVKSIVVERGNDYLELLKRVT